MNFAGVIFSKNTTKFNYEETIAYPIINPWPDGRIFYVL